MADFFSAIKDWVVDLGEHHGVDPLLIFCLYLVSKVSLVFFLGWAIKNLRQKKPAATLLLFAGISFCIPYTYLIVAGENIPVWVYVAIALIFFFGVYSIWRKVAVKVE